VLAELIAQEIGASIAVLVFPSVGPLGMVALRVAFSAIVLFVVARPRRPRSGRDVLLVVGFGVAIAAMNSSFYLAIERIPLGLAVTIEVLGPLVVSVATGRRAIAWLWAGLARVGVVLLCGVDIGRLDPIGVARAATAAACWAGYILASAEAGRRFPRLDGLAWAMVVGAALTLPGGILTAGTRLLVPANLGLGLAVALLSSAIPYGAELVALRRLGSSAFGVLMSLAPATAAAAGFLILHQGLTVVDVIAIALVVAASAGAVLSAPRRRGLAEPLA
jgi:inner membrane transporter RhtA